jgi:phosphoesterase RecJ-like protein
LWHEIISIIQNHQSFVLSSHMNPDCDALGSELALAAHLQNLGKQVTILNNDATPRPFRFLDPGQKIKRFASKRHGGLIKKADVIIVLDASGGWSRLGNVGEALAEAPAKKICIDHHPDATEFVDLAVVDTDAAATGELVFDLVRAMKGSVSADMAQALYAAILTDTGSFRFPKTNSKTHQIVAKLLDCGVDPLAIYTQLYEQNSLGAIQLRGWVMESIQTTCDGQLAYYTLSQQTLKKYGVKNSELDGFASLGQLIGGVKVTLFCTEASAGRVKISLRSDGSVAINQIAQDYGGGGHRSAAGALVEGKLETVLPDVIAKLAPLFEL